MGISHRGSGLCFTLPEIPESVTVEVSCLTALTSFAGSSVGAECLTVALFFRWPFFLVCPSAFSTTCSLSGPFISAAPSRSGRQTGWWRSSEVSDKRDSMSAVAVVLCLRASAGVLSLGTSSSTSIKASQSSASSLLTPTGVAVISEDI